MPETFMVTKVKYAGEKDNPHGGKLCECGCGERAPIAMMTNRRQGAIKGQPQRFVLGHRHRNRGPDYVEEDCGHNSPCWIWQKAATTEGYGIKALSAKELVYAHRFYYEQTKGEIPEGLELDHLCRVPSCVNPDHLEPVTHRVNSRRAWGLTDA
jgi:HNH endonuclease